MRQSSSWLYTYCHQTITQQRPKGPRVLSLLLQHWPLYRTPPVRMWLFLGRHGLAEKSRFQCDPRRAPGSLVPLLGDRLVTMGICIKPPGAM